MPTRRRFLCLIGATACAAGMPRTLWAHELKRFRWRGEVLGSEGSITLYHDNEPAARAVIESCVHEIRRLELMVSLYRTDSLINKLNREGKLAAPPTELVALLRKAQAIGDITDGAFDITVQPLWRLYAEHFAGARSGVNAKGPPQHEIDAVRNLVDYRSLDIATARLRLAWPGMALTLNGIAQGWLTDRISERLISSGLAHLLVDLGEVRASGGRVDDMPWRIGVENAGRSIDLIDGAYATSAAMGTVFEPSGRFNHLFDPRSGRSAGRTIRVSVRAASAMLADSLATALAVARVNQAQMLAEAAGLEEFELVTDDGDRVTWSRQSRT